MSTAGAGPYPTERGIVALCRDRSEASAAAERLATAERLAPGTTAVTLHTALEGHTGDWLAVIRATGDPAVLAEGLAGIGTVGVYETTFRRVKAHERTWAVGEPTPGVGLLLAIVAHPDLTHAEFDAHWRDVHAPLALTHHPGMWDYVQCSFERPATVGSEPYDGMAVCKFATLDDLKQRFFDGPEGREIIRADVARFSDMERSPAMRMTELVLV
jgi:uncharacterized protein (TIGR02118 family)